MPEKRHHPRYSLDDMEVNGKMLFATDVKILVISVGGSDAGEGKAGRPALGTDGKNRLSLCVVQYDGVLEISWREGTCFRTTDTTCIHGDGKGISSRLIPEHLR
jgi:hypothetical protein